MRCVASSARADVVNNVTGSRYSTSALFLSSDDGCYAMLCIGEYWHWYWAQLGCAGYRIARPGLIILFCGNSPHRHKFEPQVHERQTVYTTVIFIKTGVHQI